MSILQEIKQMNQVYFNFSCWCIKFICQYFLWPKNSLLMFCPTIILDTSCHLTQAKYLYYGNTSIPLINLYKLTVLLTQRFRLYIK